MAQYCVSLDLQDKLETVHMANFPMDLTFLTDTVRPEIMRPVFFFFKSRIIFEGYLRSQG